MSKTSLIFVTYTAIVFGVLYWSGLKSEKRLYDKYLIRSEGPLFSINLGRTSENGEIYSANNLISQTKTFYSELMDFQLIERKSEKGRKLLGIQLPDGNKIYFSDGRSSNLPRIAPSPSSHVFKVRNGFDSLHAKLLQREKQFRKENSAPSYISAIYKVDWGREFVITDPNENKLFFYEPLRKKGSRTNF